MERANLVSIQAVSAALWSLLKEGLPRLSECRRAEL